jgi:predicted nucleic acid-binding protein
MTYLIDSDVMSSYLDAEPDVLLVNGLIPAGITISAVTYMETMHGVLRKPDPVEGMRIFERGISTIRILPFDEAVAARCARIRHDLA